MCKDINLKWIIILFLIVFAGCASLAKKKELAELETRISSLEEQIQINQKPQSKLIELQQGAKSDLDTYSSEEKLNTKEASVSLPSNGEIQAALKKAGYYKGEIDGKIGPKSKQAILDFQKDNGLTQDGKVGLKTLSKLKEYLKSQQ